MLRLAALAGVVIFLCWPARAETEAVIDTMQEYMNFSEYNAGIIMPEQIDQSIFEAVTFIDTRSEEEFRAATIPGAVHLEWREVFDRIDEIPEDGKTILFCNTGALSAQAVFALRVAGYENVLVLQSGFSGWQENAAYRP